MASSLFATLAACAVSDATASASAFAAFCARSRAAASVALLTAPSAPRAFATPGSAAVRRRSTDAPACRIGSGTNRCATTSGSTCAPDRISASSAASRMYGDSASAAIATTTAEVSLGWSLAELNATDAADAAVCGFSATATATATTTAGSNTNFVNTFASLGMTKYAAIEAATATGGLESVNRAKDRGST